ncbi:hypothetical protein ACFQAT_08345 [Undibacterium arcticum]|uniref:hypothetical protein n=1 Tax=Undibacterium arcticum TaxID=1762892 RepID=UPI00360E5688
MEWLVIIVLVAVVWYWVKRKNARASAPVKPRTTSAVVVPEVKVTFTTSASRRSRSDSGAPRDVGDLKSAGDNAWVLNPKSPLPLTVQGADKQLAARLKALLGGAEYWSQKIPDIALIIAQHNLRFDEVDAFVAQHRRRFDVEVSCHISNSFEWSSASEKDREDLRTEFQANALESLGIFVGRADLGRLLAGEPAEFAEDDELLRQFGGDAALYSFYLTQLSRSSPVATVKADDYGRKFWEQLVEKGLARRGKDIPAQIMLDGLRLKDLNDILAGTIQSRWVEKRRRWKLLLNSRTFKLVCPSESRSERCFKSFLRKASTPTS